jgi:Holliday junction DNA helicase RuvB
MGRKLYELLGPAITKISDLSQKLTDLCEGDVLFIDEIHRIPREVQEFLYPAMEDFRAMCPVKIGNEVKQFGVDLERFTLVGATTAKGMLSDPMLERFGLDFGLDYYDEVSLAKIAKRSAALLGMTLVDDAAMEIAKRAKGTPRIANRLVRRVLDYFTVYGLRVATREAVEDAMGMIRIDEHGFDDMDRLYLSTLLNVYGGGPAGAGAIAANMQQEMCTLVDSVEPHLQRIGLLRRTGRGRELTTRGREIVREVS